MLSYISATRRKACSACVKAKRRCDLGYPCCNRCFTKGLVCQYRGASASDALTQPEVVVRQTSPEIINRRHRFITPSDSESVSSPREPRRLSANDFESLFSGTQCPRSESSNYPSPRHGSHADSPSLGHYQTPTLLSPAPQIWEPCSLSNLQINFIIDQLSTYVRGFAYAGSTPFIHPTLYEKWQPAAYQDACALSALYILKTPRNKNTISSSISAKISALISSSSFWSLSDLLAAVQALLIYQIIRLFDGELDQRRVAAKHNAVLEKWAAELWRRSFAEPLSFPTEHQSWIFYESLRRTVLMSVFLRGAWSCVTNGGVCEQCPTLNRLPVTIDPELWELAEGDWEAELSARAAKSMSTYGQYALSFNPENQGALGVFERMLLVACRGEAAMDSQVPVMGLV
ncbi:uncharacterized protein BDZ99DRAFT_458911 [Mytilinidion resinicola]|uniref:Zn(2)-C6 fungal-type domain-containing protein n=1 Tax=Mytilinidion resinicola TaxID=574789 RepID=A0A6A6Z3U5_9PEZI|nr:uncharacterized protein BDZ99DRAFT_458911 [Mytilinidion resinicola]KAF2814954.1 hypothetical protein BDZ99DRAFT_458911 [Mytilinidion resinicola]